MAVLKNDYEISLWENLTSDLKSYVVLTAEPLDWNTSTTTYYKKKDDGTFAAVAVNSKTGKRPTWEASKYYDCAPRLVERKIAIIGSDTMTSPSRALEPCLKLDINGTSTFTFKMYYHYVDPQTGTELENLWVPLLVNEAYIKVKWKGIWHDFVIKNRQEDSSGKSVTFTCEDLFITELSKTGFNLEFDTELENNQGTAFDLAKKALVRTGWTLVYPGWNSGTYPTIDGKLFAPEYIKQYIEEPVYELSGAYVHASIAAKVAENNTQKVTVPASSRILLFYSCLLDKPTKILFVYNKNASKFPTETNSILVRKDDVLRLVVTGSWTTGKRTINGKEYNCNIFKVGTAEKLWIPTSKGVSGNYRAERLVDSALSTYDAKAKKYVSIYTDSKNNNKQTYGFIGTEYNTSSIVTNLATWNDGGVDGWTGSNLYWMLYPEFTSKSNISTYNAEGYFRISPNGSNYTNNGIYSHSSYLPDGMQSGQKYMIRFRARNGNANTPTTEITSKLSDVNNIITLSPSAYFSINKSKDHKVVKHDGKYWQEYIFTCTKSIIPKNLDTAKILIKRNKTTSDGKSITSYLWITDLLCFPVVYDTKNTIIYPGEFDKESRAQVRYYYYYPNSSAKSLADISMISVSEEPQSRFKPVYDEHNLKIRSISVKQSNIFNILLTIAETFECWVRFGIKHSTDGRILYTSSGVPKKYVTFTETVGEDRGYGFVYGIDLKTILRTVQSNQLVTKTIVLTNSNEFGTDGFCTISRAKDNKPKTNFIFNFDYFVANKLLDGTELNNDLYTKSGDSIGYFTRLLEINKAYDSSLNKYKKKNNALTEQEALLDTYKKMVSSTQDEFNLSVLDIIYLAEGKTTLSAADTYFKKNGYTKEVKALINDKNKLLKNLNTYKDKVSKLKDSVKALKDEITAIEKQNKLYIKQIEDLDKAFNLKYFRYIQEGSWISENYMDDNLYYLDGLGVAYTASRPQVLYNISVLRLTALEEFKNKVFDVGDVGYVIDREFFGYESDGITPIKEQIVISSISEYFDSPEKDTISILNYKTLFEDLFLRITASSQSLLFSLGSYAKVAATINSDKTIDPSVLLASLLLNISIATNPSNDGVKIDNSGLKIVNVNNSNLQVRITAAGIMFTSDGVHWSTTIDPEGININNLKSNTINTNELTIGPLDTPSFKWNSEGLNAYKIDSETMPEVLNRGLRAAATTNNLEVDRSLFVRFDQYGVYGIENGENFLSKEYYKPVATYEAVATKPTEEGKDWENHYSDYYMRIGNSFKHVSGVNPPFVEGIYYKYDIANNNYIVLDTEPTKINEYGEDVSIWADKYTDYYILNGDYTLLSEYYDTVPHFEPGIYYEYKNSAYVPLEEEPRDAEGESLWRENWKNYYYKIDEYNNINTPVPTFTDLTVYSYDDTSGYVEVATRPDDWDTSWINYFAQINEDYPEVPEFEFTANMYYDENHNQISDRPTNWETTYYTCYTKEPEVYISMREEVDFIPGIYYTLTLDVSDEPDEEINDSNVDLEVVVEPTVIESQEEIIPTYAVLNEKPADWNTNYTDYFMEGYVETADTAPLSGKLYYTYDSENNEYDEFIGDTFDDDVIYYEIGYVPILYILFAHEGNHVYYLPLYVLSQDEERDESKTYYINNVYYEITEDKLVNVEKLYYIKDNGEYIEYNGESFDEGVDYYEKIITNEFIEHEGDLYPDYVEYYERDTEEPWLELETEPEDWLTNFDSYYFKQPDTYTAVDPILFDFNTYYEAYYIETEDVSPRTGKTYYIYDDVNEEYEEFTNNTFDNGVIYYEKKYRLVEEDPGDFYETYFTYYTHIPGEFVSIWTLESYVTPLFSVNTYYEYNNDVDDYILLESEPEDWKENYCFYFTHDVTYEHNVEADLEFLTNTYYDYVSDEYVLLTEEPSNWNVVDDGTKQWTTYYARQESYSEVPSVYPNFGGGPVIFEKSNPTIEGEWPADKYYVVENGEYKLLTSKPNDWDNFDSAIYYEKEDATGLNLIKKYARFGLTWDGFFIRNKYGWGYVAIDSEEDFVVVDTRGNLSINRVKIGKLETDDPVYQDEYFGIEIRDSYNKKVLVTGTDGNLWLLNVLTVGDGERSTVTVGYEESATRGYIALEVEPDDWEESYKKYFIYDDLLQEYVPVSGDTAPEWEDGTYFDNPHRVFHAGTGSNDIERDGNEFSIYEDGYLVASGGTFTGEIYATGGLIGGLTVESIEKTTTDFAKFVVSSNNILALVDNATMIFDNSGLTVYDSGFSIIKSKYESFIADLSSVKEDKVYFYKPEYIVTSDETKLPGKIYYELIDDAYVETQDLQLSVEKTYYEENKEFVVTKDTTKLPGKTYYELVSDEYVETQDLLLSPLKIYYEKIIPYVIYTDDEFVVGDTYYTKEPDEILLQYNEANESLFIKGNGEFTGSIYADDGYFRGNITALSGFIGGFSISDNALLSNNLTTTKDSYPINTNNYYTFKVYEITQDSERVSGKVYYKKNEDNAYEVYTGDLDSSTYEIVTLDNYHGVVAITDFPKRISLDEERNTNKTYYTKTNNVFEVYNGDITPNTYYEDLFDNNITYYDHPSIQLLGTEGKIIAENIDLGVGANITNYIKLGNAYIYNPDPNNNKFIEVYDAEKHQTALQIKDDGTGFIGRIEFDGYKSLLRAPKWELFDDRASFMNVDVTGTIHTSVFEIGKIQVVGGSMIFREGVRILSVDLMEILCEPTADEELIPTKTYYIYDNESGKYIEFVLLAEEEEETENIEEETEEETEIIYYEAISYLYKLALESKITLYSNDKVLCTADEGDYTSEDITYNLLSFYGTVLSSDNVGEYLELFEEPTDWTINYTKYFTKVDNEFVAVSQLYPEFELETYYKYDTEQEQYNLLTTKPADWETDYYNNYYYKEGNEYFLIPEIVPVFAEDTYYQLVGSHQEVIVEFNSSEGDKSDILLINQIISLGNITTVDNTLFDDDNINNKYYVYDNENEEYVSTTIFKETTDTEPLSGVTYYYYNDGEGKYVEFDGQTFESDVKYYIIDTTKTYYTIDNDLVIGVNSSSHQNKMLYPEGFTFTRLSKGIIENSYKLPVLFLGNLDYLNRVDSNIHGYGLYGENVFLTGSLTTRIINNELVSSYAGVNTLTGATATKFTRQYFPNDEPDESRIVFWAGSQGTDSADILEAPFLVTEQGSFYASHGLFKGSIFVEATIEASKLKTTAIYGIGDTPALKIYDTNTKKGGIHFYGSDNVKNLINTTWHLESNDAPELFEEYDITFTSNNESFVGIEIYTQEMILYCYPNGSLYATKVVWEDGNWEEEYRDITITEGKDVNNIDLIRWLEQHATLISSEDSREILILTTQGFAANNLSEYVLLTELPDDWSQNWTKYYTYNTLTHTYVKLNSTCPTFELNKYFELKLTSKDFVEITDNNINLIGDNITGANLNTLPINNNYFNLTDTHLNVCHINDEQTQTFNFILYDEQPFYLISCNETNYILQDNDTLNFVSALTNISKNLVLGQSNMNYKLVQQSHEVYGESVTEIVGYDLYVS